MFCITGDFNDRRSCWSSMHSNSDLKFFYDTIISNNLAQLIHVPTYFTDTSSSLLDLIITDSPNYVSDSGTLPPIALCHHSPVFVIFNLDVEYHNCFKRHIWLYDHADFNMINDYLLSIPWDLIHDDNSCINSNVENVTNVIRDVCQHFIPNKIVMIRPRDKPWMSGSVRILLRKRDRYHKIYKRTNEIQYYELWREARRDAKSEIRKQKSLYNEKTSSLLNAKTSSKTFWKLTKDILGIKKSSKIPTLIDDRGNSYNSSLEKAEFLAEYFASQNTLDNATNHCLPPIHFITDKRLEIININTEDVYKTLCNLDRNKASGPDLISNSILKNCALSVSEPLCNIFNQSLQNGVFPSEWKNANLSPLYKAKENFKRNNYRPISLLSCTSKCFEYCVFIHLYRYCIDNNLLSWRNSGYKHMDSTVFQLISFVHNVYLNLDKGNYITTIFLDISKAFDKVWHAGLLYKLECMGIHGRLLAWIKSYLTNRRQRVVVNGISSSWYTVNAGVPQGSVLGPLLFLIFINDIELSVGCNIRLFADDTIIYDSNININASIQRLNTDMMNLQTWANQWRVTFNPEKTVYMIFSRSKEIPFHDPFVKCFFTVRIQPQTPWSIPYI